MQMVEKQLCFLKTDIKKAKKTTTLLAGKTKTTIHSIESLHLDNGAITQM